MQRCAKELGGGMQVLMRKRKFAFPVKISGEKFIDNIKDAILDCSHVLIGGSKEFMLPVSSTKSLSTKEGVKNVLHCLLKLVSIALFA